MFTRLKPTFLLSLWIVTFICFLQFQRFFIQINKPAMKYVDVSPEIQNGSRFTLQNSNSSQFSIPAIIHQSWDDANVPSVFSPWIKSWLRHHPLWQHLFWSESSSRQFIGNKHPHFLSLYEQYPYKINRADVRRYFMMYQYGGVYADLDVECLKPLDELLRDYSCIIAQEPLEHQALLYSNNASNFAMPAFMACRPFHPFFKLLISRLADYIILAWKLPWNDNILKSTGPKFVADVLEEYQSKYNNSGIDNIYLAPSEWFMPTFDETNLDSFKIICAKNKSLDKVTQTLCKKLLKSNFENTVDPNAFTNHNWIHSWGNKFRSASFVSISDIDARIKDGKEMIKRKYDYYDKQGDSTVKPL